MVCLRCAAKAFWFLLFSSLSSWCWHPHAFTLFYLKVCLCCALRSQVLLVPAVLVPHAALLHLLRDDGGRGVAACTARGSHLLCLLLRLVPLRRLPHSSPGAHLSFASHISLHSHLALAPSRTATTACVWFLFADFLIPRPVRIHPYFDLAFGGKTACLCSRGCDTPAGLAIAMEQSSGLCLCWMSQHASQFAWSIGTSVLCVWAMGPGFQQGYACTGGCASPRPRLSIVCALSCL